MKKNINNNHQLILGSKSPNNNVLQLDLLQLKKAILMLRALNHKLRQQIIKLIALKKTMTVTTVYSQLNLEQSFTSQQLAILRNANILKTHRNGKFTYYMVNIDGLKRIKTFIKELIS